MLQDKTNFVSLIINGEVFPEDCMLLRDGIQSCTSLQILHLTPYQRIIPLKALEFLNYLQFLNSLVSITLSLDIHQIQGKGISDQEYSDTAFDSLVEESSGTVQLKQSIMTFRQIEQLIVLINERRHSTGIHELWLYIEEN